MKKVFRWKKRFRNLKCSQCIIFIFSTFQIFHHPMTRQWINPADCVDMDCDARRKVLIVNEDGSFFGQQRVSLISQSEFGWGGPRFWGLSKSNKFFKRWMLVSHTEPYFDVDMTLFWRQKIVWMLLHGKITYCAGRVTKKLNFDMHSLELGVQEKT